MPAESMSLEHIVLIRPMDIPAPNLQWPRFHSNCATYRSFSNFQLSTCASGPQVFLIANLGTAIPCFPVYGQVYRLIANALPPKAASKGRVMPNIQDIAVHD